MDELKNIKATVKPTEIILVVDAMTGQDAVTVAQSFDEALGIDGVLMSKMDGDARGGAALSVKGRYRQSRSSSSVRARSSAISSRSTRTVWQAASSAWVMC